MRPLKNISILLGIAALFVGACHSTPRARVEGTFVSYPNDSLTISRLNLSELVAIDTLVTNSEGAFSTRLTMKKGVPEFFYISNRGVTLTSLLLLPGDRISITEDPVNRTFTVLGSIETDYLHEVEAGMTLARHRYDSLMQLYLALDPKSAEAIALNYALGAVYVKQKQGAIRFLFTHPRSMASVQVLFQTFSDNLPLFADFKDALYFQHLHDSLQPLYPNSPFIASLRDQSDIRKHQMELNDKLLDAQELGFPNIVLPDVQAQPIALSLLQGKVIILSFWLSQDPRQRIANQDLLELYRKYASKGLVIYQVALDTDKTAWARAVAEQALPWISVCDGYGAGSSAVSLYAITQLPTHFLINQAGDIIGRDFSMEQLAKEVAKLCK